MLDTLADRRLLTVSGDTVEVAHEALLREWPRLRGWLEEDEAGRALRAHLAPSAREWEERGRDEAELYRGPRLITALEWAGEHDADITPAERAFLDQSKDAADRDAIQKRRTIRRLRYGAVGLAALLVAATAPVSLPCNNATTPPSRRWQQTCARCRRRRWTRTDGIGRCSSPLRRSASTRRRTLARRCCRPSSAARRQRRSLRPTSDCTRSSRARTVADSSPAGRMAACSSWTPRRRQLQQVPGGHPVGVRSSLTSAPTADISRR